MRPAPASAAPGLSIVSTLYRSEAFLPEFLARARRAAEALGTSFEIVLVDDGSPDASLALAVGEAERDGRVRVVELARNFGHHAAILAGLAAARGARVFLVDSDLEEPPELLGEFARVMEAEGADVVYGVHDQRVGSLARRVSSSAFWRLFNLLSDTKASQNLCHVRLMTRDYLDALLALPERGLFLGGLYAWPGFRQVAVRVDRVINRPVSTYDLTRRTALAVNSVVAFSTRPLQIVFYLGMVIAAVSATVAVTFLLARLFWETRMLTGFASVIISIWFLGGLTIMSLGVIGLYVAQVYLEAKGRPRVVVRRVHAAVAAVEDEGADRRPSLLRGASGATVAGDPR